MFGVVTIFLGIKYMWSGVTEKSAVKESLPTFVTGVIFFYLADSLYTFFNKSFSGIFLGSGVTMNSISGTFLSTFFSVANVLAIIAVIVIGLKYMFSAADSKSEIKTKMLPVLLGIVFIFCFTQVLQFIINTGSGFLGGTATPNIPSPGGSGIAGVDTALGTIWSTFKVVAQTGAIIAIVFAGVRYMFSGADSKADIKEQTFKIAIGAGIVFAAVNIISFVSTVGKQLLV